MVTVCRGGADVTLWMMRLEPPMEVMVGTVSTLTARRTRSQFSHEEATPAIKTVCVC